MNRARNSITSLGLAVLLAACSSSSGPTGQGGSGGKSNSSGGSNGGSGGTSSSSGGGGGGSSSSQAGGAGGGSSSKGGAGGGGGGSSSKGGAGGGAAGNAGGASGAGGGASGAGGGKAGNSGTGTGGKTGGPDGGAGAAGGGSAPDGGPKAETGGTTDTGSTPSGAAVFTSTNGSCVSGSGTTWTAGTISASTGSATVTVNDSSASQTWEGFGGAFNEKGWQYLQMLSSGDRDRAMQLLFAADGANFNIGRIPMGASDYAVTRYTCDESTSADTSMSGFNTTEDEKYVIPFVKAAMGVKSDIKFWASPWTPPTWMKTGPYQTNAESTNQTTTSNFDSGNMKDDAAILTAYAQYFTKFVAAYKALGIDITMVAPQNEPNYALCYPTCLWASATYAKFVGQYLGPALKDTGVSIMLGTLSNADSGKDIDLANAAYADASAKPFFTVAGVQWSVLDKVESGTKFGTLPVWATEHKCGNYPWGPSSGCGDTNDSCPAYNSTKAPNDQAYGVESWKYIRNAITKGGVTAYNAWNMVLDTVGAGNDTCRSWNQDALLTVDTSSKALNVTSSYCVFRHFSQFVAPGAKRVATNGGDAVAFKNPDNSIVAVMYNSGAANSSYGISIGGQKYQFSMPANGWATVTYTP